MNNKALMGFAISVVGVVAGLYVYKMLTDDSEGSKKSSTTEMFRGRR